jgi:hypothetical protein
MALEVVTIVRRRRQVDEELRWLRAFDMEPLARFERATYGLRRRIPAR